MEECAVVTIWSSHAGEELYARAVVHGDGNLGDISAAEHLLFQKAQERHHARLTACRDSLMFNQGKVFDSNDPSGEYSDLHVDLLVSEVLHKVLNHISLWLC